MPRVDCIAKNERLTREVLIREVLPNHNDSIYFKEKKKELLSDLGCICSRFDLEEKVIIYCFIRLWNEGRVDKLDFWASFNDNRIEIISVYLKQYYANLEEAQNRLWEE